jgi:glycosyltransferase involved in cell wall biosynthesis
MTGTPRPLRIGYVAKMFPRLSETFVLNEILELERQGAEVVVFSAKKPNEGRFHPQLARLKAQVIYFEDLDTKKWAQWISADWDTLGPRAGRVWDLVRGALAEGEPQRVDRIWQAAWMAARCAELKLDRLHAHFATLPAMLAYLVHRVSGIPYSFTAHAKDIFVYAPEETRLGELIEHADFMVTVTEYNRRYLCRILPGVDPAKIEVVHNGIDLTDFEAAPAMDREEDLVLGVGRLVPKKGFDDLLRACAVLKEAGRSFRCVIAGGGVAEDDIRGLARELDLEDVVTFTGPVKVDHVRDLMRRATVFALPCRVAPDGNVDALPTVLLEALASGLPGISTSLSGVPEIISDGREGLLIPPDDPEALARAVARLLDSPDERRDMAREGRRKAEEAFDIRLNVERMHRLFKGLDRNRPVDPGGASPGGTPHHPLYLCTDRGIPFGGTKGAAIHVAEFIGALMARGTTPSVAVRRRDRSAPRNPGHPLMVLAADQPPHSGTGPAAAEGAEFALNAGFVAQLDDLHRANPVSWIYERYSLFGTAGLDFARRHGLPLVLEVNAPLVEEARTYRNLALEPLAREIARDLFAGADQVLTVSDAVRDHVLEVAPGATVTVLPNGVDVDRIRPDATTAAWRERVSGGQTGDFVVGFVGRVRAWHGVDILVDAVARARKNHPDIRLCIVGEAGDCLADLVRLAEERGLGDAMVMTGPVPHDEIPAVLGSMDLVAAPYPALENFYFSPLKVFEYMAAGLPIVASAIGQVDEILTDGETALLVPAGDAEALAAAVSRLREDADLRAGLGRRARETAVREHSWADRVATVETIVSGICQGGVRVP